MTYVKKWISQVISEEDSLKERGEIGFPEFRMRADQEEPS
jgi:hypothetical protein